MDTDQKILEVVLELKDKLGPALGKTGRQAETSMAKVGKSMKKVGAGMSAFVTLPILAAGAASVKLSTDFNAAMANIATLIPGQTARVQELKGSIQQLAIETGKGTADMADGMYAVISAFGDGADTVKILEINAKAAAAGLATTADAILLTSGVTKAYGDVSAEAVQHVSDLALLTVRLGQTTFPELANAMGKVTAIGSTLNVSQEELFATFATLTGVTGGTAEVSTQMRGILGSMIKPSEDMAAALEQLGFAGAGAAIEQLGLVGALQAVIGTTDGSNEAVGKLVPQIEALPAVFALAGEQAAVFETKLQQMRMAAGTTDEAFAEITGGINTAGFKMAQFGSTMEVIAQKIGDVLAPVLGELLNKLMPMINAIVQADPAMLQMGVVIAGVAAAIGPLLMVLGQIITMAPAIGAAITVMTGPWGIAIAAIVAGVALIIANWDSIKQWADTNFPAIGLAIDYVVAAWMALTGQGAGEKGGGFIGPLTDAEQAAEKLAGRIQDVKAFWDTLTGNVKGADFVGPLTEQQSKAQAFAETIGNLKDKITGFAQSVWDTVQPALAWLGAEAMELVQPLIDWFTENMPLIQETFSKVLDGIRAFWDAWGPLITAAWEVTWTNIKLIFGVVWETIKAVFKIALDLLLGAWKVGMQIFTGDWEGAWNTILETGKSIWKTLTEWWDGVSGFFVTWFEDMKEEAPKIWSGMWTAISNTVSAWIKTLTGSLAEFWKFIVNAFKGGSKEIVDESIWPDMWEKILSVTEEYADKNLAAVVDMTNELEAEFKRAADSALSIQRAIDSLHGKQIIIDVLFNQKGGIAGLDAITGATPQTSFDTTATAGGGMLFTIDKDGKISPYFDKPELSAIDQAATKSLTEGWTTDTGEYTAAGIEELVRQGINLREMLEMGGLQGWNEQLLFGSGFVEDQVCGPDG